MRRRRASSSRRTSARSATAARCVTNNSDIDTKLRKLRNHGSNKRNVHSFGFNSRLDDLHAGVLSAKLKHIHAWNDHRITVGDALHGGTLRRDALRPAVRPSRVPSRLSPLRRSRRRTRLTAISWSTSSSRTASTPRPTTRSRSTSRTAIPGARGARLAGPVPNAERNAASCVSLPMYPELTASGSRLRHRQSPRVGQGAEVTARTASSSSAWASAACTMPRRSLPIPRFQLAGICSRDPTAAGRRGLEARDGQDEYRIRGSSPAR